MDSKKAEEIKEATLDAISGGVTSESIQENPILIENERAAIMKDLLHGFSARPSAPECTDTKR